MINSVPKFDGTNYVEWTKSFNDILQISWPFLSKIISGLKKLEPLLKSREENFIEGSYNGMGNIGEHEPSNVDGIEA